jgi:glycosyltransferase involved in cell wall biosynthesis
MTAPVPIDRPVSNQSSHDALSDNALSKGRALTKKLRIAVVSTFYSPGMGYSENCLPRSLAALGHDVHLVTSTYNVYGNEPGYDATYRSFLGPPIVEPGTFGVDGYQVHRLPTVLTFGYPRLLGLRRVMKDIRPDIIHALEIASLATLALAFWKFDERYKLFCESHQHLSVVKPYMRRNDGASLKRMTYFATRTLPVWLASLAVEKCYAIAPDCAEVAAKFYGVPRQKIRLLSLGTDTTLFHPADTQPELAARRDLRLSLGCTDDDVLCLYSGRFSLEKNPLLLAQAIDGLARRDIRFRGIFIGDGVQKDAIAACKNVRIVPFMKHSELAAHYRAADVAVWPTQESMSMLDAAASALPVIASDRMGEADRIRGNGHQYREGSVESMQEALLKLSEVDVRRKLGRAGRQKMVDGFSWARFARSVEADYYSTLAL